MPLDAPTVAVTVTSIEAREGSRVVHVIIKTDFGQDIHLTVPVITHGDLNESFRDAQKKLHAFAAGLIQAVETMRFE